MQLLSLSLQSSLCMAIGRSKALEMKVLLATNLLSFYSDYFDEELEATVSLPCGHMYPNI